MSFQTKGKLGMFRGPVEVPNAPRRKVIHADDTMAFGQEEVADVGADEPSRTRDEDRHPREGTVGTPVRSSLIQRIRDTQRSGCCPWRPWIPSVHEGGGRWHGARRSAHRGFTRHAWARGR